jgi:hypothetical protein
VFNLGGNGLQYWNGGTQNTVTLLTSLASTGGATATVTLMPVWSIGNAGGALTKVIEPGSNSTAATGITVIIGI